METLTFKNIMYQMFYVQHRNPYDDRLLNAMFDLFEMDKKEFYDLIVSTLPREYAVMLPCKKTSHMTMNNWYHESLCSLTQSLCSFFEGCECLILNSPEPDPKKGSLIGSDSSNHDHMWHLVYTCILINCGHELNVPSTDEGFNFYDGVYNGSLLTVASWSEYYKELLISKYG